MKHFGVKIDAEKLGFFLERLNHKQIIFTPNPEILLKARSDKRYKDALRVGTLMLPDGNGLQFVSTLLRIQTCFFRYFFFPFLALIFIFWKKPFKMVVPEIIHGSDFMVEVVAWAKKNQKGVYFLGAESGVAQKTAEHFQSRYPGLKVAGFSSAGPGPEALKEVLKAKPDVLFVAYGAPKQELWVAKNRVALQKVQIVMTVGGSFDFWSGHVRRAPRLLRAMGLEWLWRLILSPLKRFKRIWNAVIVFPFISFYDH